VGKPWDEAMASVGVNPLRPADVPGARPHTHGEGRHTAPPGAARCGSWVRSKYQALAYKLSCAIELSRVEFAGKKAIGGFLRDVN
jgi:hypothetical protein